MHAFYYSLAAFGILAIMGEFAMGFLSNTTCLSFLGCNVGVFGYDGLMHLVSGLCVGHGLAWMHEQGLIKKVSVGAFFAWGAVVAVVWEFLEWCFDVVREMLLGIRLTLDIITQPNAVDTVSDIVLGLIGTGAAYAWLAYVSRRQPYGSTQEGLAKEV